MVTIRGPPDAAHAVGPLDNVLVAVKPGSHAPAIHTGSAAFNALEPELLIRLLGKPGAPLRAAHITKVNVPNAHAQVAVWLALTAPLYRAAQIHRPLPLPSGMVSASRLTGN